MSLRYQNKIMLSDFAFGSCYDIFLVLQKENLNRGYHALLGLLSVRFQKTKKSGETLHLGVAMIFFGYYKKENLNRDIMHYWN